MTTMDDLVLVELIDRWRDGDRFDWLHPTNGRFPDLCQLWQERRPPKHQYTVAVWYVRTEEDLVVDDRYVSAAEGPDCYHNGILQTYPWWVDRSNDPPRLCCGYEKDRFYYVDLKPNDVMLTMIAAFTLKVLRRHKFDPDVFPILR